VANDHGKLEKRVAPAGEAALATRKYVTAMQLFGR
jgi:hypothetical protein